MIYRKLNSNVIFSRAVKKELFKEGDDILYEIIQKYISNNRSGETLSSIGSVVHETSDPGATVQNEWEYFNSANRDASAHAFIDWNSIMQTIPWDEVAWGSGPTSNHRFWQIELCRPTVNDPSKFKEVWERGAWLFAYLFTQVANPRITTVINGNLMSHAEVSQKWNETTHTDPVQYFAEYGRTVDDFRNDVQAQINQMLGGNKLKAVVVIKGNEDIGSGQLLAEKLLIGLFKEENLNSNKDDTQAIEGAYLVGGGIKISSNIKTIKEFAGKDRFATAKLVSDFVTSF